MKQRYIFAWKLLHKDFNNRINALKSVILDPLYNYMFGNKLFGLEKNSIPHPKSTNIFHLRGNLGCHMPIERLYHQKLKYFIFPKVCSIYSLVQKFTDG